MSWLFSRAMIQACENSPYLQERGGGYLEANSSDGEQSAPLSVMPTPHKFWRNDKTMECSNLSRFGLTCAVLTESRGEELLTLFRAGFLAKISAAPEKERASPEREAGYGRNLYGLFAKYDRDTCSWKTAQCSLLGDSELFSETWPKWGMTRNGAAYLRQTAVPLMCERESGLLRWPTPVASVDKQSRGNPLTGAEGAIRRGFSLALPHVVAWRADGRIWPTPTVNGNHNRKGLSKSSGDGLSTAVKKWPTPTAHNAKETNAPAESNRNTPTLAAQAGGALNPEWVEWLMAWPIGWTDLKPLGMGRFLTQQQQHSEFYQGEYRV